MTAAGDAEQEVQLPQERLPVLFLLHPASVPGKVLQCRPGHLDLPLSGLFYDYDWRTEL